MKKNMGILFFSIVIAIFAFSLVSAGVGISWDKESSLVPEKSKTCLTYKVYNPWPKDVYAKIELSDELTEIIKSQDSEVRFIPRETSSAEAIPVTFCFKTPSVYQKDCLIGNVLICKQDCKEELKTYSGEVEVIEMSEAQFKAGGAGGSATQMSVSAPLKVRVQCVESGRNWSVVYITVALVAAIWLILDILRSKRKADKKSKKKK